MDQVQLWENTQTTGLSAMHHRGLAVYTAHRHKRVRGTQRLPRSSLFLTESHGSLPPKFRLKGLTDFVLIICRSVGGSRSQRDHTQPGLDTNTRTHTKGLGPQKQVLHIGYVQQKMHSQSQSLLFPLLQISTDIILLKMLHF